MAAVDLFYKRGSYTPHLAVGQPGPVGASRPVSSREERAGQLCPRGSFPLCAKASAQREGQWLFLLHSRRPTRQEEVSRDATSLLFSGRHDVGWEALLSVRWGASSDRRERTSAREYAVARMPPFHPQQSVGSPPAPWSCLAVEGKSQMIGVTVASCGVGVL